MDEIDTDIAHVLKLAPGEPPADLRQSTFDPSSRRRRADLVKVIGSAMAMVIVAAGAVAFIDRGSSQPASASRSALPTPATPLEMLHTQVGELSITHPAEWAFVRSTGLGFGNRQPVGYFTNLTPSTQCASSSPSDGSLLVTCGPPVSSLSSGGVLIIITNGMAFSSNGFTPNTTGAGVPMQIRGTSPDDPSCPAGTKTSAVALLATVPTSPDRPNYEVEACLASVDPQSVSAMNGLLASIKVSN